MIKYKGFFSYICPLIGDENVPQLFAIQPTGRRLDVGLDRLRLSIADWAGSNCRYVAVAISFAALATSASAGVFLYLFLPDRQRGKLCRLGLDNDSSGCTDRNASNSCGGKKGYLKNEFQVAYSFVGIWCARYARTRLGNNRQRRACLRHAPYTPCKLSCKKGYLKL